MLRDWLVSCSISCQGQNIFHWLWFLFYRAFLLLALVSGSGYVSLTDPFTLNCLFAEFCLHIVYWFLVYFSSWFFFFFGSYISFNSLNIGINISLNSLCERPIHSCFISLVPIPSVSSLSLAENLLQSSFPLWTIPCRSQRSLLSFLPPTHSSLQCQQAFHWKTPPLQA